MPKTYNPLPQLIDFASKLRYEDLPANVVHEAKRRAIDAIGCAMGALSDGRLVELAHMLGGTSGGPALFTH